MCVYGSSQIMLLQHLFNTIVSCVLLTTSSSGAKPCISRQHCYQIVDTNITWATASRICKEDDGHLIFIETAAEQQVIADQMQKRNFSALTLWIGSANVHAEEGPTWDNGDNFSYVNWAEGEPNTPPVDENCAEIYTSNFKWNDRPCTHMRGYICEMTSTFSNGSEPCMTVGNKRHCYQIAQTMITWTEAFDNCSQDGDMLVIIESEAEQKFIEDQMQKITFTVEGLWIGADKLHPEYQRTWANGQQFTYVNWAEGEPNNMQHGENCAEISTSDYTWNDAMCSSQGGYICEYPLLGTSDLQVWVIIVPVGLALILLVGVLLLCCFLKKRRKNQKEKKVEVYQGLQEMEMRKSEHIYNEHIDLSDVYSTIDD